MLVLPIPSINVLSVSLSDRFGGIRGGGRAGGRAGGVQAIKKTLQIPRSESTGGVEGGSKKPKTR